MNSNSSARNTFITALVLAVGTSAGVAFEEHGERSDQKDKAAIERLHQMDVEATYSGKADDLARLWDADAVRILPGGPAEVGKAAIYAGDQRDEANGFAGKTACYRAEIKDLQLAGDWAFEWGYFSFKSKGDAKVGRGKVMRVMKRQPDGSWKFARVIGFTENSESAVPLAHPCE